jgi:hypothetical protein
MKPVRRLILATGLLFAISWTVAGCSTAPARSAVPIRSSEPTPSSAPVPSSLPTTTTTTVPPTTTTIASPPPLPVGTTTTLGDGTGVTSIAFTVHHIWTHATPQYEGNDPQPGANLSDVLRSLFTPLHLPLDEQLAWVGFDFTVTNNGEDEIEGFTATGPGVPVLNFAINGYGGVMSPNADSDFTVTGFAIGVPDCSFPSSTADFGIQGFLASGHTWSGCVALAVPAAVKVSSVGFALGPYLGTPSEKVALWSVPSQ